MTTNSNYNVFSQFATKFHEMGFKVLPVKGKRPITDWKEFRDVQSTASVDLLVDIYREADANTGIGLILDNNICAIDVDTDDVALLSLLPASPCIKRGAKGETRFYKHHGLVSQKPTGIPVELLASGCQTVIPPSLHSYDEETGKSVYYVWTGAGGLETYEDWPTITQADFDKLLSFCREMNIVRAKRNLPFHSYGGDGFGRNNTLMRLAQNKISRAINEGLSKEAAVVKVADILINADKDLHPNNEYFLNDHDNRKFQTINQAAMAMASRAYDNMFSKTIKGGAPLVANSIESVFKEEFNEPVIADNIIPSSSEWEACIPSSGALRWVYDYYMRNSINPIPQLGVATAITVVSVVSCNLYASDFTSGDHRRMLTWPNLFSLVVAPSGTGKDSVQKVITEILALFPETREMISGNIVSGSGIMIKLKGSPKRSAVFVVDEMQKIFKKEAGGQIINTLLATFSGSNGYYGGADAADKRYSQTAIWNPSPVVIGATTPAAIKGALGSNANDIGLLNRFLYFTIDERTTHLKTLSDSILETDLDRVGESESFMLKKEDVDATLKALMVRSISVESIGTEPVITGDNQTQTMRVKPDILRISDRDTVVAFGEACQKYENTKIWMQKNNIKFNDESADAAVETLLKRSSEQINKLALIYAVSMGLDKLTASAYRFADAVYNMSTRSCLATLGDIVVMQDMLGMVSEAIGFLESKREAPNIININDNHFRVHCRRLAKNTDKGYQIYKEAINTYCDAGVPYKSLTWKPASKGKKA